VFYGVTVKSSHVAITIAAALTSAPPALAAESRPAQLFTAELSAEGPYSRSLADGPSGASASTGGRADWSGTFNVAFPDLAEGEQVLASGTVIGRHQLTTTGVYDGSDPDPVADEPFECRPDRSYPRYDTPANALVIKRTPAGLQVSWQGLPVFGAGMVFRYCRDEAGNIEEDFATFLVEGPAVEAATAAALDLPASAPSENSFERSLAQTAPFPSACSQESFGSCSQSLTWSGRISFRKSCRNGAGRLLTGPVALGEIFPPCLSPCDGDDCDDAVVEPRASSELRVGPRGGFRLPVGCYGRRCRGALALRTFRDVGPVARRRFVLAKRSFSLEAGEAGDLRIRLSRRARRLLPARSEADVAGVLRLDGPEVAVRRTPVEFLLRGPRRYRR
jgi:hypothetical protein